MMPNATSVSGMYSVEAIAENAGGKHVHSSTMTKMSQTWFASHTGPMTCSMSARRRLPCSAEPANRSQMPAPKSAPPSSAYAVSADHISTSSATLADMSHHRQRIRVGFLRRHRHRGVPGHASKHVHEDDREDGVDRGENRCAPIDAGRRVDRI